MKHPAAKFECVKCGYSEYRMSAKEVDEIVPDNCPKCHRDMKVIKRGLPQPLAKVEGIVDKRFEILDFAATKNRMEFEVSTPYTKKSFLRVLRAFKSQGYVAALREREGELRLQVVRLPKVRKTNVMVNLLLFLATLGSTFFAGCYILGGGSLVFGFLFSVSIMLILGIHELGHKLAAWKHGIESTPPYFIPVPFFFLGTLGAIIRIKSPIPTKEALVEMGMNGPLLGFLVALPITAIGLAISGPVASFDPLPFVPLAFGLMTLAVSGPFVFNPLTFAGWVGMFVTMLNLIPAGQLDGGHVARGLLNREDHYRLTRMLGFILIFLGFLFHSLFPFLMIWGFLILLMFRGYHMGALDDVSELPRHQRNLSILAFLVFLLCIPVPK